MNAQGGDTPGDGLVEKNNKSVPGPSRKAGNRTSHLSVKAHIAQSPEPPDRIQTTHPKVPIKAVNTKNFR